MHLTRKNGLSLFIITVVALCIVEVWVATSPAFAPNSAVFGLIITIDLLVGIPLLFYGLVVRPYRLSSVAVVPIFLLAVVLAGYILPPTGRSYLNTLLLLIPLIELAILGIAVWQARAIYQRYHQAKRQEIYFIDALETSVRATFGKNLAITLLTIEFSLIFLACFGWFMKFSSIDPEHNVYTYHRKSRYPMVFMAFLLLMAAETIGLHLLIQHWSPLVAWIVTGTSIYTIFWIIGDFNAIRLHPIVLADDTLHLRSGFRWSAALPVANIVDVQRPRRNDAKSRDYLSFARAGEAQMVLVLEQPVRVSGLFGITKQVSRLGLFLDDARAFRAELERRRRESKAE